MALARAHDILTLEQWAGADLRTLAMSAFRPFDAEEVSRFNLSGPAVRLGPREALLISMALHELATNAIKYGALSQPGGRVEFNWILGSKALEDGARPLSLLWRERGGPEVMPPVRRGFGSRLMEGLAHELRGKVTADARPEGMVWRIDGRVEPAQ
jgi:two-component sensor histidine kinase